MARLNPHEPEVFIRERPNLLTALRLRGRWQWRVNASRWNGTSWEPCRVGSGRASTRGAAGDAARRRLQRHTEKEDAKRWHRA